MTPSSAEVTNTLSYTSPDKYAYMACKEIILYFIFYFISLLDSSVKKSGWSWFSSWQEWKIALRGHAPAGFGVHQGFSS